MTRIFLVYIFFITVIQIHLIGNENNNAIYSLGINYSVFFENSQFAKLPGIPNCCEEFSGGTSKGFDLFFSYEKPIFSDFHTDLRLNILSSSSDFTALENTFVNYRGGTVPGTFQHNMNINTTVLFIQPGFSYNLWNDLYLELGIPIGFYIFKDFKQYESIFEPGDAGTFLDSNKENTGKRIRNEYSGYLPLENRLIAFLNINLSYMFPLNKSQTFFVKPVINFNYGLSDFFNELNWTRNFLSFGLSISYIPETEAEFMEIPQEPEIPIEELIPAIPIEPEEMVINESDIFTIIEPINNIIDLKGTEIINSTAVSVNDDEFVFVYDTTELRKTEYYREIINSEDKVIEFGFNKNQKIQMSQSIAIYSLPLLNFMYFDLESPEITGKEIKDNLFGQNYFYSQTENLNRIGLRLQTNTDANLKLTTPENANDYNIQQWNKMAFKIKDYLIRNFNLSQDRITLQPGIPSTTKPFLNMNDYPGYGYITFESIDNDLFMPYTIIDTIFDYYPNKTRFNTEIVNNSNVSDWSLTINANDKLYRKIKGKERLPQMMNWDMNKAGILTTKENHKLNYEWNVNDNEGNQKTSEGLINFEKDTINSNSSPSIENKFIILFEPNSTQLTIYGEQILDEATKFDRQDKIIAINSFSFTGQNDIYLNELRNNRLTIIKEKLGERNIELNITNLKTTSNTLIESLFLSNTYEIILKK